MQHTYLLGLDSGSTLTKAVIFDEKGHTVGVGHGQIAQHHPRPHWVERDMHEVWVASAAAVREALAAATIDPRDIVGVGVTGHGDGLYVLDAQGNPLGPGIMSLDSRAMDIVENWRQLELEDSALALTGQFPFPYAPNALLGWMRKHQPERFSKVGTVLSCKDWLRYCLTGQLATDFTEASTAFTEVNSQRYSREALALFGLSDLWQALPDVALPTDNIGCVTAEAAEQTGLVAGTPVVAGLHDVTASAVGLGHTANSDLTVVSGTFSINEVFAGAPHPDSRWATRNGLKPGQWLNMAISPASASNIEWFLQQCCTLDPMNSRDILQRLEADLDRAFGDESRIVYHPFLYGSPYDSPASAAFFGVQGWHTRAHLLRAILEGVVFNHRVHVDALAERFKMGGCRVTGGGGGTPRMAQLFADTLGLAVEVPETREAAALGAALCAGVGAGLYASLDETRTLGRVHATYIPNPATSLAREKAFNRYQRLLEALSSLWPQFDSDCTVETEVSAETAPSLVTK